MKHNVSILQYLSIRRKKHSSNRTGRKKRVKEVNKKQLLKDNKKKQSCGSGDILCCQAGWNHKLRELSSPPQQILEEH
jgi:hypothetical protein